MHIHINIGAEGVSDTAGRKNTSTEAFIRALTVVVDEKIHTLDHSVSRLPPKFDRSAHFSCHLLATREFIYLSLLFAARLVANWTFF